MAQPLLPQMPGAQASISSPGQMDPNGQPLQMPPQSGGNPIGPPGSPEEAQARAAGWDGILQTLSDPGMASALFQFGTAMMQPRDRNQSATGFTANALQNTLQQQSVGRAAKKAGEEKTATRKEKSAFDDRRIKVAERGAATAESREERGKKMDEIDKRVKEERIKKLREEQANGTQTTTARVEYIKTIGKALQAKFPTLYKTEADAMLAAAEQERMGKQMSRPEYEAAQWKIFSEVTMPDDREKDRDAYAEHIKWTADGIYGAEAAAVAPVAIKEPPPNAVQAVREFVEQDKLTPARRKSFESRYGSVEEALEKADNASPGASGSY